MIQGMMMMQAAQLDESWMSVGVDYVSGFGMQQTGTDRRIRCQEPARNNEMASGRDD